MNWSKSKKILILALLALNIVLLVNIFAYRFRENISRETVKNTKEVMTRRGVVLKCEIPLFDGSMPALVLENGGIGELKVFGKLAKQFGITVEKLAEGAEIQKGSKKLNYDDKNTLIYLDSSPEEKVDISSSTSVEKYLRRYFSGLGFNIRSYSLDQYAKVETNTVKVTFIEKYKKYMVFSNYLEVSVTDKGITEFRYRHHKVKMQKKNTNTIMPAYQILLKNFEDDGDDKDIFITSIDIGYKSSDSGNEMKETREWPTWRILIEGRTEPIYFNANNGEQEMF